MHYLIKGVITLLAIVAVLLALPISTPLDPIKALIWPSEDNSVLTAMLTCGVDGNHMDILLCFNNSSLVVTKDGVTKSYRGDDVVSAGSNGSNGLRIGLPGSFEIVAQNSAYNLTLEVIIVDQIGDVVFRDRTSGHGTIRAIGVSN